MSTYFEKVLQEASEHINGTGFKIEKKTSYYIDERGFQRCDTFPALTFIDPEGNPRFLSVNFCWWV